MKRRRLVVFAAAVVGLTLGAAWYFWKTAPAQPVAAVPVIATEHLHPLVRDAIVEAVGRVESDPQSAKEWGALGILLVAHGMPSEARFCLQQAARLDPNDFRWPYFIGYSLETDDFDAAMAHYEVALERRGDYLPLRIRMARILMRLGELNRCRTVLDEAPIVGSPNPYLFVVQGQLAMLEQNLPRANERLMKAAQTQGWLPQPAYIELVKLAGRRGDFKSVYEYQRKLAQLPSVAGMEIPDSVPDELRRVEALSKSEAEQADLALARRDLTTAISTYQSLLRKRPDLPNLYTNLAHAYALSGNHADAITTYQDALKRFGDIVAAHIGLAATYDQTSQPELAIKHYSAVLRVKPNHQRVWFYLGMLHEKQGRLDDALHCYQRSVAVDPSFPQAELAWAVLLIKQNRDNEARPHIVRAVALAPNDAVPKGYLKEVDSRLKAKVPGKAQKQ